MTSYRVVDDETSRTRSHWDSLVEAEIAAAEANADWPFGMGPFCVQFDVDSDNDPYPDPDDAYDPD